MRKALPALAASTAVLISALTACGGSHDTSSAPKTLMGNWHQSNSKQTGVYMVASITGDGIQINTVDNATTRMYWMGSFNGDLNPNKPFKYTSLGNSDAMASAIFASSDKYKSFGYKNGVLSYKYTILGTTSTIKLVKDDTSQQAKPTQAIITPDDNNPDFDGHYYTPKKPKTTVTVRVPSVKPAAPNPPAYKPPVYKAPAPPRISTRK